MEYEVESALKTQDLGRVRLYDVYLNFVKRPIYHRCNGIRNHPHT